MNRGRAQRLLLNFRKKIANSSSLPVINLTAAAIRGGDLRYWLFMCRYIECRLQLEEQMSLYVMDDTLQSLPIAEFID